MGNTSEIIKYQGLVKFDIIGRLLNEVNEKLENLDLELSVKKKVYNLMGECLENVDKHAEYPLNNPLFFSEHRPGISIDLNKNYFKIVTVNAVMNDTVGEIKSRISQVNNLDRKGLKDLYKRTIITTEISEKGGAGLGIINMAIISENKLEAVFSPINDEYSEYTLIMKINLKK